MAHLMRPGMYNAYHHISIPAREKTIADFDDSSHDLSKNDPSNDSHMLVKANVVGNLCENNDW
jgi:diaminopimelate decarboxylase